jgi:dienelactone hydrolase
MPRTLILLVLACWGLGSCLSTTSHLSIPTTAPHGALEHIPATVSKPDGPGPFPAVVILHDCSGLSATSSGAPGRWA